MSLSRPLGRYWCSLLHPLTAGGRTVAVAGHLAKSDYYDPHGLSRFPLQLPRVVFSSRLPRETAATTLICDGADLPEPLARRTWAKTLRLTDATETMLDDVGAHYRLPFSMFPRYVVRGWEPRFVAQRERPRTTRVLFAGNTTRSIYDEVTPTEVRRQHGIDLTRPEAIDVLTDRLSAGELVVAREGSRDAQRAFDGSCAAQVLLVGWNGYPDESWIGVLGAAGFFLALPGVFMPMSHNVIEAMAAGCIPILCYPGWFTPALTDGVNCLTYSDADSLVDVVRRALAMSSEDVERLSRSVCDYYDAHLAPGVVPGNLDALPDGASVFLQTEQSGQTAEIRAGSIAYPG